MSKIVPIVEGDGEVSAVPALLARMLQDLDRPDFRIGQAKNAHGRTNLIKPGGLEKFLKLALKDRDCGAILLLIDTEGDCPGALASLLATRVRIAGTPRPVAVVCAHHSYEAWLLAAAEADREPTPGGRRRRRQASLPHDVDTVKNPKAKIDAGMPPTSCYKETQDQLALTRKIDFAVARTRSRSFRYLWSAVEKLTDAIVAGDATVTP